MFVPLRSTDCVVIVTDCGRKEREGEGQNEVLGARRLTAPREADSRSVSHENFHVLWRLIAPFHFHKSPNYVRLLVLTVSVHCPSVRPVLILLPSGSRSINWSLFFWLSD